MFWKNFIFFALLTVYSYASPSRVYVSIQSAQIAVIDPSTNDILEYIPVPGIALGVLAVTPSGEKLYVAGITDHTIKQVDIETQEVTDVVTGILARGIAITSAGIAYITDNLNDAVIVLDTATNQIITTITNVQISNPWGIFIPKGGTVAYVSNSDINTVCQINLATNQVINSSISTSGSGPRILVADRNNTKVYVVNDETSIAYLNLINQTSTIIPTTGSVRYGLAISPDNQTVYGSSANTFYYINTNSNSVVATVSGISSVPGPVALNRLGTVAYVTSLGGSSDGRISVIDTTTQSITTTIIIPSYPQLPGIAIYDPDPDVPSNPYEALQLVNKTAPTKIQLGISP